jgi:hypothetical protein
MEYLNILEKLKLLFELVSKNYLFIAVLAISLTVFIINKLKLINTRKMGLIITLTFVLCFSIILFYNSSSLFKVFDNISNLIFRNIYFPSIYVYIAVILISNSILIMSVSSKKMTKLYKNINITVAFIINFLFLILINTIGSNDIDILSTTSMYTNNYFVSLIELTTSMFILWMISILTISIINSLLILVNNKKLEEEPVKTIDTSLNTLELEVNPSNEKELEVETHPLNANSKVVMAISEADIKPIDNTTNKIEDIKPNTGFAFNDFIKKDNILLDELKTNNNGIDKLMSIKPIEPVVVKEDNKEDTFKIITDKKEEKYTKEDYKLFYDMLNQVRANNNGKSMVTMDDALSVNLLNKFSIKQYNLYKKMLEDIREC